MLYCCFCAWLPVCSVLTSAELLRHAPASARNRNLAYLFQRASDCRSWMEQIRSAADLMEVITAQTYQLRWWGRDVTQRARIWRNLGVRLVCSSSLLFILPEVLALHLSLSWKVYRLWAAAVALPPATRLFPEKTWFWFWQAHGNRHYINKYDMLKHIRSLMSLTTSIVVFSHKYVL